MLTFREYPMMKPLFPRWAPFLLVLLLSACGDSGQPVATSQPDAMESADAKAEVADQAPPVAPEADPGEASNSPVREIEWDSLIPDDFRPDKLMEEFQVDDLADDDPRAVELMDKLQELWDQAPVRPDMDGAKVKLPGFVVPVEADSEETTGFLLVPYYGACVHVPPPPANQTVYVQAKQGQGTRPKLFDIVSVTGTMRVQRVENEMAAAGYTLDAVRIEPYEEPYEEPGEESAEEP